MTLRFFSAACVCMVATVAVVGCSSSPENQSLTLATTTSTRDTGLLDLLVPLFQTKTGIEVKVVAVGSGQALELGRRGDADVLLVHDPVGERRFMEEGFAAQRHAVMYNDFVLVGPAGDPANLKGERKIAEAFSRISRRGALFISRGDESGTHQKEKAIWRQAGIEPQGDWYLRARAGMGQVLRMASEKRAYTLSDRGTFLAQQKGIDVEILCEGDPLLVNPYSVIVISRDRHPHVRSESARKFADFLLSAEGRKAIAEFGKDKYDQPLFFVGEPKH
jgi:tungstate transport system substrate-binding protein